MAWASRASAGCRRRCEGLLAQQRSLDVTSHNVANANTVGYSRQEAVLAPRGPLRIAAGATQDGSAAELGTGVDVLAYRAPARPLPRPPVPRPGDAARRPGGAGEGARIGRSGARRAGRNRDLRPARQILVGLGRPRQRAREPGDAAGADRERGRRWRTASPNSTASSRPPPNRRRRRVRGDHRRRRRSRPDGERNRAAERSDPQLAQLPAPTPTTCSTAATCCSTSSPALAQVSVTDLGDGTIEVDFGDAAAPLVEGTTVTWPQALTEPGGKLGALLELFEPGGHDRLLPGRTERLRPGAGRSRQRDPRQAAAAPPSSPSPPAAPPRPSKSAVNAAEVQTSSDRARSAPTTSRPAIGAPARRRRRPGLRQPSSAASAPK